jgi:hypothetical protein
MNMKLGKVVEARVTKDEDLRGDMRVRDIEQLEPQVKAFNERREGNFKMVLGETEGLIVSKLREELKTHFFAVGHLTQYIEFRVNFNAVEDDGTIWEGFTMGNLDWFCVSETGEGEDE